MGRINQLALAGGVVCVALLGACANAAVQTGAAATGTADVTQALRERPITVLVELPPSVADVIATLGTSQRDDAITVRLTIEGVSAAGESSGLRVFVGRTAGEPSNDSPAYVGSVSFGHSGPFEAQPTDSFLLNIAPALRRLPEDQRLTGPRRATLPITLAPRTPPPSERSGAITIKRLAVSVHRADR